MANSTRLSPRQKMINLMYIVLTAMLALNVSADVLDGFTQVEEGLQRSNTNVASRNDAIYDRIASFAGQNPEKGEQWLRRADDVREFTAGLYREIDSLKTAIVHKADGKDGNPAEIRNRDDLEASSVVMLNPTSRQGERLRHNIDAYRTFIITMMPDSAKRANIESALSTENLDANGNRRQQSWEEANFESKPVVAAVTLLSKLENDVRYAEGEALSTLYAAIDAGDVRVNELNAFVIPRSRSVMRGGQYSANIVLAAVDTTQRPTIFIGGKQLPEGSDLYQFNTSSTGSFDYSGYLQVRHGDGSVTNHEFTSSYTVFEPTATVSATMMNVLYAGIDNPISISVPGVHNSDVNASMTNGTLTRSGNGWLARPSKVGAEAVITVTANVDGRPQTMATTSFRTRKLPDPTPYISFTDAQGNPDRIRGDKPISKSVLQSAPGIGAAIDDDLLNIHFNVVSFQTVFYDSSGNAIPENSDGPNFSARQREQFRRLQPGKRFYISSVKASGPDGITRTISPLEVIIK
ncbi:MAG: gliding motility protein GldM [Muribaculaceae bacterium]|nr:gliding motility protein GldM [Muribaculaceae bacterium]